MVARPGDGEDLAVVEEAVEDRGGDDVVVAEDAPPLVERHVGGDDHRAVRVFLAHELEEERRALRVHRRVAQLVDDQQFLPAQLLQLPPERVGDLRGDEAVEERRGVGVEDALARETGLQRPGQGEVRLPDAGRADQQDVRRRLQERQRPQLTDPRRRQAGLEGEVELRQGFARREVGVGDPGVDGAVDLRRDLLIDEPREEGGVGGLALGRLGGLRLADGGHRAQAERVELGLQVFRLGGHRGSPSKRR